jgi:hypothetical protein
MEKYIGMTEEELNNMILSTAEYASTRILERYGQISPFISRQEIIDLIGRASTEEAFKKGHLSPIKKQGVGKNAKVYCLRSDFDRYLLSLKNAQ